MTLSRTQIPPLAATATMVLASADVARPFHTDMPSHSQNEPGGIGGLKVVQVVPAFVDAYNGPSQVPTNTVDASAEIDTRTYSLDGKLVGAQI